MMPPFSVNVFVTSAWLMPHLSPSIMLARLFTGVGSPLLAFPAGPPGGGAMLSLRPLPLPPPDDELGPPDDDDASSGFAGSAEDACLGSFG